MKTNVGTRRAAPPQPATHHAASLWRAALLLLLMVGAVSGAWAQTDVTGYETVTVTIPATSYDASAGAPQMASVKYNKTFPLVLTSDDMGKTELTNNWAELNGYPNINGDIDLGIQPGDVKFLQLPYKKYYTQAQSQSPSAHEPMTYTDNVGKTQRYRMTCAVMPYDINSGNYAKISANDAKLMLRTGFSFAQHDVDDISSIANISAAMTTNNATWESAVGIGLKVMVEPNGNHNYLAAGVMNSGICWNIFQNPTSEYPANSKTLTSWANRTDWTATGITAMPSTFSSKPTGGYTRSFFQGHESEWKAAVDAADGTSMIIGGTHGLGDDIKSHLRSSSNVTNNAWVCGADEAWEYYHIYNNLKIENVSWDGSNLTFDVLVPTYQKNQFRELTINIPGLTGGGTPTFSGTSVITGGYSASGGSGIGYTMNIGLETSINDYIDQLTTIYRDDQTNAYVKRDIQYLIDLLWDGATKTAKQSALDASPTYTCTVTPSLGGTPGSTLATIMTDTNGEKQFALPRYILSGGTLYETTANATGAKYIGSLTTSTESAKSIAYTAKDISALATTGTGALATPAPVFYAEGEDLTGATVVGADFDCTDNSSRYYAMRLASMGMGGCIVSGTPATVTATLPRGKYKMVIGYGDTATGTSSTYNVCVGGTSVYSFTNSGLSGQSVTEFTSTDFDITIDNTPVTITSDYTDEHPEKGSHWIDYVYIVQTADLDAAIPTLTFGSSLASASIKIGTTATLTATAVPNGGSGLTTSIYAADSEGTPTGSALATGSTTATYDFTPAADGTYYFVAQSTNSAGTTTSSLITLTAVSIDTYTLSIVDKSGNVAMTATLSNPGTPAADPLPDAYRSPFAENYHYYLNSSDAQNNNTANALATTADWSNATIYVGYDVKSTFGSDKNFAVWANSRYMHAVYRVNQAHSDNRYYINNQNYDISDIPSAASSVLTSHNDITTSNYALLDNHYTWQLGDDPYNVKFKNKATDFYASPTSTSSAGWATSTSATYCILYWTTANGSSTDTTTDGLCRVYYRGSGSTPLYVMEGDSDNKWLAGDTNNGKYAVGSQLYIKALPEVTVNVLNSHGVVEAQIQAYNNPTATMQSFIPYSMLRAYTSGQALYYDAAHTDAVTSSAVLNASKLETNGNNLYMTYAIDDAKWRTVVKDAVTYYVHSYDATAGDNINWYGLRYNKTDASTGNYLKATTLSANLNSSTASLSDFTGAKADDATGKLAQWVLKGTPYHLEIANRSLGIDNLLGLSSDATSSSKVQVHAAGASNVLTTWEAVTWLNQGKSHLFFRPQGGFNAQAPYLYLSGPNGLSQKASGGEMFDFYWAAVDLTIPSVTLTASAATVNVGTALTLTATPTLGAGSSLSNLQFWKKVDDGAWTLISTLTESSPTSGTAYAKTYTPDVAGTYTFKATVSDNNSDTGESSTVSVTVSASGPPSVTCSTTASSSVETGTVIHLSATPVRNGGPALTLLKFQYKTTGGADGEWTDFADAEATVSNPESGTTYTYDYTPTTAGNYSFRATVTDGTSTGVSAADDAVPGVNDAGLVSLTVTPVDLSTLTFIMKDWQGNLETNVGTGGTISGIDNSAGTSSTTLASLLADTYRRQYCQYTFYKDAALTQAATTCGDLTNSTVYVQWTYTDNAPVFSTGSDADAFQYYALTNRNLRIVYMNSSSSASQWSGTNDMTDAKHAELAEDESYQWAFVGTPYSFIIYNRGQKKYVGLSDKTLTYGDLASAQEWEMDAYMSGNAVIPITDSGNESRWGTYRGQYFVCSKKGTTDYGYVLNLHGNATTTSNSGNNRYYTYLLKYIVVPITVYEDAAGSEESSLSEDAVLRYPFYAYSDGTLSAGSETVTTASITGLLDASHDYTYYTNSGCTTLLSSNPISTFGGTTQTRKAVYALYYSAPTPPTVTLTASSATTTKGTAVTLTATATKNSGTAITKVAIEQQNADGSTYTEVASVTDGTTTATYSFPAGSCGDFYFRAYAVVDNDATNLKGETAADVTVNVAFPTPKNDSYTLTLYDKSNIEVFSGISVTKAEVQAALGDALPGKYRSPFVANYKYYATQAEAVANSGTEFDWANSDATTVYVGYEVDGTKMAAAKEHIIYSGWTESKAFMHPVYRGKQSNSNNFQNRYNMQHQKWDQENDGITPNAVNAGNLPFVDQVYMWSLGTDPYHVMLTNNHIDSYKYVKTKYDSSNYSTAVSLQNNTSDGSVFSLLYWNGDTSSDYVSLRYLGDNTGDAAYKTDANAWYLCYDGGNNGCWRLYGNPTINDSYKFVIKTLPSLNVNVVNAAKEVEYTMKGYYVEGATVPSFTPFFLQRSYTSNHKYYYNSACTQYATPNGAIDGTKFDGANIYVKYNLSSDWNTENLFQVSDATNTYYYLLNYTANTSTPYLAVDGTKKVIGLATSTTNEAHWALYGTPYALRIENRANSGYYVGIPETAVWNTNPQVYNSFSGIISTWELAAYTNSNITADYKPLPVIRPQGSISRETPLLHLRPDGTNAALFDHDDNLCRVTFEDATKVQLVLVDKSGREVFSEYVPMATITSTSGDPLSAGLRSPYAKNYKYYATKAEAQANSGTALNEAGLLAKAQQTVYVGYDAITADNVTSGETILKMNGTAAYRIRRNANNTQGMHAVFAPSLTGSEGNNYGWKMFNQTKDDYDGSNTVVYNTLPFIDRSWAWEFVSTNNDPYNVKIRNKATGQYLRCENNSNRFYPAVFAANETDAAIYSLLQHGSGTQYLAIYVSDGISSQTGYMYYNSDDGGKWSLRSDRNDATAYIRIEELTEPLDIHIVGPVGTAHAGEVEATIHGYRNKDVGANTIPAFVPYFLQRAYTSGQKFYYTQAAAAAATSGTEIASVTDASITDSYGSDGVKDVFVSYTLDDSNWIPSGTTLSDAAKSANTTIIKPFYSGEGKINWYGIRADVNNSDFLKAGSTTLPTAVGRTTIDTSDADTDAMKLSEWAFIGTPYNLQIAERYHYLDSHLGVASDAVSGGRAYVYASDGAGVVTTFELLTGLGGNTTGKLFLRPQGSLNGQTPYVYIGGNSNDMPISIAASGTQALDLTWIKETDAIQPSTVHLTVSNATPYVDDDVTLTATATPWPSGTDLVTSLVIEQETSTDVWTPVGTAYAGTNVAGATKDPTTKAVTVTWTFTPNAAGTYNFRAHAVIDAADQYSTDASSVGGDGSALSITASVFTLVVNSDNYKLRLVDKQGNILFSEDNVPASRVSETNSISHRNGDPIDNSWRSPLVSRYYYYKTLEAARDNTMAKSDLFDWSSTEAAPTVYVGYQTGTAIDLNSSGFSSVNELMTDRTYRTGTTTNVRNASKFGTMYMLKFKMSAANYLEDGSDDVEETATTAGTYVYPYTNGDGPMYIYTQARWDRQKDAGASTRTRWPWYLVSPTNDPYHVVVTSWQNSHGRSGTNYYSYLRTYYNSTLSQVVTNNVTDDPKTRLYNAETNTEGSTAANGGSDDNVPTEYMVLYGNRSYGDYRLTTVETISDGSTTERRTVNSFEQYWRNNPTALYKNARANKGSALTDEEKTALKTEQSALATDLSTLTTNGWHNYKAWVNAAPWAGGSKSYAYDDHWFMTVNVGDGSFDLVETDIDAVLVLLDNHGWEVMRQNIVKHKETEYASVQTTLRKYDSPMVAQYKFYGYRNVNHKVPGYHKYVVAEADRVSASTTFTSLADYPEKYSGGALYDLYVTYDVKPEYTNSYTGAATEAETSASQFLVRQGSSYAKASGSSITGVATTAEADAWYLKPNFDIDAEMGYQYGGSNSEKSKADTDQDNYDEGRNGFDPYNLRIQNVSTSTYFTTAATNATLNGGIWTDANWDGDNPTTVSLTDLTATPLAASGHDNTTLAVTNATFMAVQDANGNMRLMPRFDHSHLIEGFTVLAEPAAAQPANDESHSQTTLLTTGTITYHIVDNSGDDTSNDVFGALTYTGPGFAIEKIYQSPMVEEYYFHGSKANAVSNRAASTKTSFGLNDEVWISYKVKDDFATGSWSIWNTDGHYMHAVSRNLESSATNLWWMSNQNQDRQSNPTTTTLSTATMPFLDNSFAWLFGNDANTGDPYNAKFYNKAARRYTKQNAPGTNNGRMDHMQTDIANATPYAIVYYDSDESNGNAMLYDRTNSKYVYYNSDEWQTNSTGRPSTGELVFAQLPALSINIVAPAGTANAGQVECTLEGYYKSGASWTSFVPLFLERRYTSGHTFYYTLADAVAGTNAVSGTVNDANVTSNGAVYVKYTLDAAWGTLTTGALTTDAVPSPTAANKIQWYGIKSKDQPYWLRASTDRTAAELGAINSSDPPGNGDTNDEKRAQWALIGTPYNLRLIDRYHGMGSYLGVPETSDGKAYVYSSEDDHVTTWEVVEQMGGTGNTGLQIRPQRSFNGETDYGYVGFSGVSTGVAASPNGNLTNMLYWLKETDARNIIFKLYDRASHYMAEASYGNIADQTLTGYDAGMALADVFGHTTMQRRYCEYTFYSDATLESEVTAVGSGSTDETVYVRWDYTDDAPVFNEGVAETRDYQYYMMGVGSGNNYTLMDVEESGGTYTFKPMGGVVTPRDLAHQFAIVGNPYAFRLYNRGAGKFIRRTAGLELTFEDTEDIGGVATATTELEFDMPILSTATYSSTECHFRSRTSGRFLGTSGSGSNAVFSMISTSNPTLKTRFRYIIVPVRVFKEGETTWTSDAVNDQKDYRMYGLEMNPDNTARTTSDRITTDYLRASGNAIGTARDFIHAFCDYTYYRSYDWSSLLSQPIPSEGLPYYGGKEQYKKQFFATYTVDEQAFSRLYYMNANNREANSSWNDAYIGKGTAGANGYTLTGSREFETQVKTDESDTYRWFFTGDPYNMQIHCVGVGDLSSDYALASKTGRNSSNSSEVPSEENGQEAVLTTDLKENDTDTESYGQLSRFEIIQRSSGKYVLWSLDTGERYDYCLTNYFKDFNGAKHLVKAEANTSMGALEWNLVDVFNHYTITWHVMENQGTTDSPSYADVASKDMVYDENTVLHVEDLPQELRRHFCQYSEMYSDDDCTAAIANNAHTVTATTSIYVPYTLDSGAPDFLKETDIPSAAEKNWYEVHYPGFDKLIYYKTADGSVASYQLGGANTIEAVRDLGADYIPYRWLLIGTPYSVKLYNMQTETYLTSDGSSLSMSAAGTAFDLMDDVTGEFCAIYDEATGMFVTSTAGLQASNSSYYSTAAEFTNTYGVVKIAFVLHYSGNTLRQYDSDNDYTLDAPAAGTTETITIDSYQKLDKALDDVLPTVWKRAFCQYTYDWDATSTESTSSGTAVTTVTQAMVDAYNANKNDYLYVHVTYDYSSSPFLWSTTAATWEDKHWYYLVNNHIQGTEQGKMVYRDSGPKLRVSTGLVDGRQYLYNFEWCVVGDPYGFKMLNHYDPDQLFSQYVSVTTDRDMADEGKQIEQQSGNSQCLFEMMPGRYSYNFWMHPIYADGLMGDEYSSNTYTYVGHNYNGSAAIIPDNKFNSTYLHNNSAANLRLEKRTTATLKEYLDFAGFVGSIKTSVVPEGLEEKIANGTATDEELRELHNLIDNPDNLVQMTQGYYRIIPYMYEKGQVSGEEAHRRYVRGYHYGAGTNAITNTGESTASYSYYDRFEYEAGNSHNRALLANEKPALAEYDPASIFHFEATTSDADDSSGAGRPRFLITTQGLSLDGHSLTSGDGSKTRYEDIGAVTCQLKTVTGDPTNGINRLYLSWQQNAGGNEPADYRRMNLRNCFEMYGLTRLYIQPVGSGSAELPLKLEMYPGTHTPEGSSTALDYYFASLYVPYDVVLPDGEVYAYAGKRTKNNGTGDEKDWRLQCEKLNAQTIGGTTYAKGKFIPAGTPVLVRAETTAVGGTLADSDGNVTDYDYDHASTTSGFITLTIPNNIPATAADGLVAESTNLFKGKYLEQVLSGTAGTDVPASDESVYIFGQATGDDYTTIETDDNRTGNPELEAGFYINKNTPDGSAEISKKNNLYVRHNKIYLFEKKDENDYPSSSHYVGAAPSRRFIALDFGETGIEELDGYAGGTPALPGVYDMQGRRVASGQEAGDGLWRKGVKAGVYIENGRKVVVK